MGTNLTRIGEKARKDPKLVFTSLYHHITDIDNLRASYDKLLAHKASGIDGVTKEEYGKQLEENLRDLSSRLKRMGYRPSPKRRTYVPKPGSEKGRPLGISNFEDKIVEEATKRTLEPIYEAVFEDSSYGYRPGRSPHQCLDALGRTLQQKRVYRVVEADIKAFFDTVNHAWLMKFLKHRIGDERVLRLIVRMLKSGILEDGLVHATDQGTPQGSILSPLLSNIYLHYVLDVWFSRRVRRQCQGEAYYFRFADDFLACFQYKGEAESFRHQLEDRLEGFGLKLAMEKTHCLEFVFRFSWKMTVLKIRYTHEKRRCHEQTTPSSHRRAESRAVTPARCGEKASLGGMQRGSNPAEPVLHVAKGAIGWSPYGVFDPSRAEP